MSNNNLKVAVRIRPLSQREINYKAIPVVAVTNKSVISITNLKPQQKCFGYRHLIDYWKENNFLNILKEKFNSGMFATLGAPHAGLTNATMTKKSRIHPKDSQILVQWLTLRVYLSTRAGNRVPAVLYAQVPIQNVGDSRERIRRFTFDYCFQPEASQSVIFNEIENDIKNAIKNRYHSCILAYGQSSSGKTHTMIGSTKDHGIIPRVCQNIFKYLKECLHSDEADKVETTISYLEIYNEKVRDLLSSINQISDDSKSSTLKVREHPKKGPYVQGLSKHTASDPETIQKWFDIGKSNRSIAATLTNPYSSRSHSVFTLSFGEGVQLHLIDLAGSEKAGSKRISNLTFTEGSNINKSLVALGNVISTLAERGTRTTRNQSKRFIPYRDSVLTWLLKDTLGGNSKTVLIATVSPSNTCYTETVNTLRFGQSAKKIVSCPVVNEDPKERLIRELRVEIAALKQQLAQHQEPRLLISSCIETKQQPSHQLIYKTNESSQKLNNVIEDSLIDECNHQETSKINKLNLLRGDFTCIKGRNDKQSRHSINENFIPTMEVTSDLKKAKDVPPIRRTSSIGNNILKPKSTKSYGSLETISNVSKEKAKRLSQPAVLRQNSLLKPRLVAKPPLVSKPKVNTLKHQERGIVTEEKGPPTGDIKRSIAKPRSQIVAAVTSRLYGKVKKKEVGTETDVIPPIQEVPKELTICSNARLRLQELTRQALKAHRRKTTDTQTDMFPVLRVKEMSTDVDDLKLSLVEIKDAQTETIEVQTNNVGVNCQIQNFEPVLQDVKNSFIITKSCGTQSSDSLPPETKKVPEQPAAVSSISFKKYLQGNSEPEPTYTVINPCTSNPIYTSAVNFNVSHNYINHNRVTDTPSDDSLEDQNQANNLCFPDIISNHNSLELGTLSTETAAQKSMLEEKFASTNTIAEQFRTSNVMEEFCWDLGQATCLTSFQYADRLNSINVPVVHAPQVCLTKQFSEKCLPFYNTTPKCSNSKQSQTELLNIADSYLPQILKPSTIQKCKTNKLSKIPHCENKKLPEMESDKMFKSMSKFMEEATNLMTNLTLAAEKLQMPQAYDLEVTVSGIDERLGISEVHKTCQDFTAQTFCGEETSTQTSPPLSLTSFKYPVNKYEESLKQSCRRLEDCIGKIKSSECPTCKDLNGEVTLEPTSQLPFQDSTFSFESNYSLQSNIHSDYGSLGRNSKRCSRCTPSAYLKQLTYMRKQILDYSKSEL